MPETVHRVSEIEADRSSHSPCFTTLDVSGDVSDELTRFLSIRSVCAEPQCGIAEVVYNDASRRSGVHSGSDKGRHPLPTSVDSSGVKLLAAVGVGIVSVARCGTIGQHLQ